MPTSGLSFKKIQRKSITFWLQTRSQFCTDYYFIMTRKYGYLYYLQNKMEPSKNILIDGFQAFTIWTKYWNFFFSIFKRKEGNIPTALHNQHMNTFWLLSAIFARATKIGHFFLFLIPLILPGAAALCEEMRSPAQHLRVGERGTPCRTKPPSTVTWTTNPPQTPSRNPEAGCEQWSGDDLTRSSALSRCPVCPLSNSAAWSVPEWVTTQRDPLSWSTGAEARGGPCLHKVQGLWMWNQVWFIHIWSNFWFLYTGFHMFALQQHHY